MSKARIMSAGTVGTSKRIRVNGPEGGGNALQGLPPICNMRSPLVPYVRTRADGENRNVVFCVNQLSGGVGAKRGQFGPGNRAGVGKTGGCNSDKPNWTGPYVPGSFNELLQLADEDGDGNVSTAELEKYFEGHVDADNTDNNNDGIVSQNEFMSLRYSLGTRYALSNPADPLQFIIKAGWTHRISIFYGNDPELGVLYGRNMTHHTCPLMGWAYGEISEGNPPDGKSLYDELSEYDDFQYPAKAYPMPIGGDGLVSNWQDDFNNTIAATDANPGEWKTSGIMLPTNYRVVGLFTYPDQNTQFNTINEYSAVAGQKKPGRFRIYLQVPWPDNFDGIYGANEEEKSNNWWRGFNLDDHTQNYPPFFQISLRRIIFTANGKWEDAEEVCTFERSTSRPVKIENSHGTGWGYFYYDVVSEDRMEPLDADAAVPSTEWALYGDGVHEIGRGYATGLPFDSDTQREGFGRYNSWYDILTDEERAFKEGLSRYYQINIRFY